MRRDNGFHVWHARIAKFERVPVEDLVKWVILRETFVNDIEELPS